MCWPGCGGSGRRMTVPEGPCCVPLGGGGWRRRTSPARVADRVDRAAGEITDAFSAAVRRFARDEAMPWVDFVKGQRKDDVMHEHLAKFEAAGRTEVVLFVGRAQEKTELFPQPARGLQAPTRPRSTTPPASRAWQHETRLILTGFAGHSPLGHARCERGLQSASGTRRGGITAGQRRAWDSNPRRRGYRLSGFQDRRTRPLCEPSWRPERNGHRGVVRPTTDSDGPPVRIVSPRLSHARGRPPPGWPIHDRGRHIG